MDNTLPNSTEVAFDDIEQLEELYHSIVEPNLPKSIGEEGQESLDLSEESQMKTVLGLIVQKCFEKIKGYRFMLEQQKKSVDDVQLSFDDLQEENAYLKGTQKDLLSKIEKLKLHVDEIEEMNESLHNEISELKLSKMRIELLGMKAKATELDSPQLNVQNLSSSEIVKPLQEEMRSQELEIERLRETMLVQEQLLEKLQTEVDRYHSIESKYDQLKGELNNVGQPTDMSIKNNTKLSILAERINNIRSSLNSGGQKGSPGQDEDADESYNRNFVITQNLKLRAELNRSQKRHKSLVEDVISTRMSEQPKENSTPNLNLKESIKSTFLLDKNSLFSLKEKKEKLRYAVDSDLDGQNSESAKSDKVELEIEPLKKEKVLLTWLEGDISNSDSKSDVSSSSIKFKKSKKELPKSKFMREEELDTTVGATERMGFKSSIDSYMEKKEEVNSYEIRELEKETTEKETGIDNAQKNDNLDICRPKQSIDEYLRNEKKKAKENTQFSIFNLIIAVVFRSRA